MTPNFSALLARIRVRWPLSPWGRQGHARRTNRPPSHRAPGGVGGCRLCQPSLFRQGVVGAFAEGFGVLTSDFRVGTSQDLGS